MTEHVDKFGLVKEMYNMKKICLVVFSALTIVLELLPCGTVCIFATSPTERVKETGKLELWKESLLMGQIANQMALKLFFKIKERIKEKKKQKQDNKNNGSKK